MHVEEVDAGDAETGERLLAGLYGILGRRIDVETQLALWVTTILSPSLASFLPSLPSKHNPINQRIKESESQKEQDVPQISSPKKYPPSSPDSAGTTRQSGPRCRRSRRPCPSAIRPGRGRGRGARAGFRWGGRGRRNRRGTLGAGVSF